MADRIALAQEKENLGKQQQEIVDNYNQQVKELLGELPAKTQASLEPLNKRVEEINAILLNDIDKEHRVFLKKAFDKGILTKVNGVWKHNTLNIGMTDDQAIVWLKDNGDTYALLKHQLRTGVTPVEETIELEEVEQHPLRAGSAISEIEKEIDNLKK